MIELTKADLAAIEAANIEGVNVTADNVLKAKIQKRIETLIIELAALFSQIEGEKISPRHFLFRKNATEAYSLQTAISQAEVKRLKELNNKRGAKLAAIKRLCGRWGLNRLSRSYAKELAAVLD